MESRTYELSPRVRIRFGPGAAHDVVIEQGGNRVVLTEREWAQIIDRSPYMHQLAERYPAPV
jgi:hypothetical protein